ncbi:MAG: M48 family metallopeptidase [Lachnospiraceae bacterium]|nr:M48 family metallopeptidase [Lachnospiraceae bacterium]
MQVTADGGVVVRAPLLAPAWKINRFLEEQSEWIAAHVARARERSEKERADGLPVFTDSQMRSLTEQAKQEIPPEVRRYAALMGIRVGRITIRSQHTVWGSSSAKGNLNFNCLLMLVPEEVRTYVIVHELCHQKQMNHSALFWAEVEKVLPDYRQYRKWLKDNGSRCIRRLPAR